MTTISIGFLVTLASVLVTMSIHVCFDVSSAPQLKDVSLQFFPSRFSLDAAPPTRRTLPFANALVATHHSPIVCRFAAGSGAGDRRVGAAAADITKAGSGAGESRNRSGSR